LSLKERLQSRLVCKRWKKNIDDRMEAFTLSSFTLWCPYTNVTPVVTPKLRLDFATKEEESFKPMPPRFRETAVATFPMSQLPFTTKSLAVVEAPKRRENEEGYLERVELLRVLGTCGTLLTSLSIAGTTYCELGVQLSTLIGVLSLTPNLKALHLSHFKAVGLTSKTPPPLFPAFPQLKTLLFHCVRTNRRNKSITDWYVEPYLPQLTTLDIWEYSLIKHPAPLKGRQENLKQLKVEGPGRFFFEESEPAPFLQRLAINNKTMLIDFNVLHVLDYIDKFSQSLFHLHLDVELFIMTVGEENRASHRRFAPWRGKKLVLQMDPLRIQLAAMCNGLPVVSKTFPCLKTLAICYPDEEDDVEVALLGKVFLPKFPALENLILLHFRRNQVGSHWKKVVAVRTADDQSRCVSDATRVCEFLEEQNYWKICQQLRKITVVYDANYDAQHHIVVQEVR